MVKLKSKTHNTIPNTNYKNEEAAITREKTSDDMHIENNVPDACPKKSKRDLKN
jgi:hypothetical protein